MTKLVYEIIGGSMTVEGTVITAGLWRAETTDKVRYLQVDIAALDGASAARTVAQMFNDERLALEAGQPSPVRFVL